MRYTLPLVFFCLAGTLLGAQQPLRLSLRQAIVLASSPHGSAAVQSADAAVSQAQAQADLARSFRYPLLTGNGSVSNLTRNLGAEGFNFPTGVPGFTIPNEVGPFNVYDARIEMTQTVFDLGAVRRSRAVHAALQATTANAAAARQTAGARAAHDYLAVLAAEAKEKCAGDAVAQTEAAVTSARHDIEAGKASDAELSHAELDVSATRQKLIAAQNAVTDARLQLLDDLGLDFDTQLELTDSLGTPGPEDSRLDAEILLALKQRPELQAAAGRLDQARDESGAVHAGLLPTVSAYGDVGPQNSVITHTVGISARITLFDGGRRSAEEKESTAAMQQYTIQQRDLRRQIELEVRRAFAAQQSAMSRVRECDSAVALSAEERARAQRRFAQGVGDNAEVVNAELAEIRAREDAVDAYLAWNQARLQLAQATGTVESLEMPPSPPATSPGKP